MFRMFRLLQRIYDNVFRDSGVSSSDDTPIDNLEEPLELLRKQEEEEINYESDSTVEDSDNAEVDDVVTVDNELCQHRSGIITKLCTNYGLIDDTLHFEFSNLDVTSLKCGMRLKYVAFRTTPSDDWHVSRVLSIEGEDWDEGSRQEDVKILKKSLTLLRKEIGQVKCLREDNVTVARSGFPDINFSLNKIKSSFRPMEGDWLSIEATVEVDGDVQDFAGEVLDVHSISPLRERLFETCITTWDEVRSEGVIDQGVWFNRYVLPEGYTPHVDEHVIVKAIESNQGAFCWRAVQIVPTAEENDTANESSVKAAEIESKPNQTETRNGIRISTNLNFGVVLKGETKDLDLEISNLGKEKQLLVRGRFHGKKGTSQLCLVSGPPDNTVILPGQTIKCIFKCKGKFLGESKEVFVFTFRGFKIVRFFNVDVQDPSISKFLSFKGVKSMQYRDKYALAREKYVNGDGTGVTKGPTPFKSPPYVPVRLKNYVIPRVIWEAVLGKDDSAFGFKNCLLRLEKVALELQGELTPNNYVRRFHTLLFLEEIEQTIQLHYFDMKDVILTYAGPGDEFFALEVPGLAENRPSLLVGDRVTVVDPSINGGARFEGVVHKVCTKEVWLKFHSTFHSDYNSMPCSVFLEYGRAPLKKCHSAVDLAMAHLGPDVLFPSQVKYKKPQVMLKEMSLEDCATHSSLEDDIEEKPIDSEREKEETSSLKQKPSTQNCEEMTAKDRICKFMLPPVTAPKLSKHPVCIKWINPALNHYQKLAVTNALRGEARPLPYVIFGPPGTGKTITLVETILQIYHLIPDSRILIATPSNSSANLIAQRLLLCKLLVPGDLVRLVAHHIMDEEDSLPESLRPYSTTADPKCPEVYAMPALTGKLQVSSNAGIIGRHRITVGTCVSLGQLYVMGFPKGHFTHVCVDEAGQATEPELLIPLGFLHKDWGQAVLAGDPLQLGPVVASKVATHYGFAKSYLARLLESLPYQQSVLNSSDNGGFNPQLVTRLVINYRSLPEILSLPSALFYNSQLMPQIDEETSQEAATLKSLAPILPKRNTALPPGIVFHGVRGTNLQEEDCPSWCNPQELVQVLYYLKDLYKYGLSTEDIGVITPYRKQVQKLRALLTMVDMPIPKIGSVEEFQGQERLVIIVSTVRSNAKMINHDILHALGFVASPQRVNVAITRARALLIIIGNPHLLSLDPFWKKTLVYCVDQDAYVGCDLPKEFVDLTDEIPTSESFESEIKNEMEQIPPAALT